MNGGCVGSHGQVMTILPGQSPCFRCLVEDVPEPGSSETCDTAGVIGPAVNIVASLECVDALKILAGKRDEIAQVLTVIDVWDGTFRRLKIGDLRAKGNCPACGKGERAWLRGERASQTAVLCGGMRCRSRRRNVGTSICMKPQAGSVNMEWCLKIRTSCGWR